MKTSASLVLYKHSLEDIRPAIDSWIGGSDGPLHLIDNSPEPLRGAEALDRHITYTHIGKNLGFGAGHNVALRRLWDAPGLHFFLNPDVEFGADVAARLVRIAETDPGIAAIGPKVIDPATGAIASPPTDYPTALGLFLRRFSPSKRLKAWSNARYQVDISRAEAPVPVPVVSGCFFCVRTEVLKQIGGFDERFFMYMEDVDLLRRAGQFGRVTFAPEVEILHQHAQGSYKSTKLLVYHLSSAYRYFRKWSLLPRARGPDPSDMADKTRDA